MKYPVANLGFIPPMPPVWPPPPVNPWSAPEPGFSPERGGRYNSFLAPDYDLSKYAVPLSEEAERQAIPYTPPRMPTLPFGSMFSQAPVATGMLQDTGGMNYMVGRTGLGQSLAQATVRPGVAPGSGGQSGETYSPAGTHPPQGRTDCKFIGERKHIIFSPTLNDQLNQSIAAAKGRGEEVYEIPPEPCPPTPEGASWEFTASHPSCIQVAGEGNVEAYVWACPGKAVVQPPPTGPSSKYDRPPVTAAAPAVLPQAPVETKPDLVPVAAGAGVVAILAALIGGAFGK